MPQTPANAPKKRPIITSWRVGCLAVWAFGLLVLLALAGALFVLRPDPSQWLAVLGPKPACNGPQLTLGGTTFRIQNLRRAADGSIPFPADSQGIAYWMDGTSPQHVFALSPAVEHLKLAAAAKPGDVAKITWTDCSSGLYAVRAVEVTRSGAPGFFDRTGEGLTIFIQADASGAGMAIGGELVQAFAAPTPPVEAKQAVQPPAAPAGGQPSPVASQATPTLLPTSTAIPANMSIPTPNPRDIQAEIGFQGKQVTATTITLNISVYNYGSRAFAIKMADVNLLPPNQKPASPSSVNPALPFQMASLATQDFTFTFPNPGGNGIIFKLLNVEFNLDDF